MSQGAAFRSSLYCTANTLGVQLWSRTLSFFSLSPGCVVEVLGSKFGGQNLKNQVFTSPVAICNSWPITRNITRSLFLHVNNWFIWVFDEPGFLLIRRSLVRAQVEEPPKKASSKAMFFPFIRHYLSRWGPLGDFLLSNFVELLHVYYTVDGVSQEGFYQIKLVH